jgi:hypothetical protein
MHQAVTRNQVRNADTLAVALGGDRQAYVWSVPIVIGLTFNPAVYRVLASSLPAPDREVI